MHESQSEEKSILKVVIHSFFVVPLIIAIFAVIIFLVIRIMTTEPNSARDYLEDVKIGGSTKRWQGAFELSKMLSNPKMIPKDDLFANELIATFEYSSNDLNLAKLSNDLNLRIMYKYNQKNIYIYKNKHHKTNMCL